MTTVAPRDDTAGRRRSARSLAAEAAFRARLAELGAVLLEERWLGNHKPHRLRCAAGHVCNPRPDSVQRQKGICRICAGKGPGSGKQAEAAFRIRVEEQGGTVLEPTWLGVMKPHRIRCSKGHESSPWPTNVQQGVGICRTCAGNDPAVAEAAFRARLAELGATLLEERWLGANAPHRVRCAAGHESAPSPGSVVRQGNGACRTCAGQDPEASWNAFRVQVEAFGGVVLEPEWLGNRNPHRARCAAGHECNPRPSDVQRGQGICRTCANKVWDAFYVVVDEVNEHLKFGITSGDPRPRLRIHERDGFDVVLRVATGLPGDVAPELERQVRAALRDAGEQPVRGREYFPLRVQALVLDLVNNHPAVR